MSHNHDGGAAFPRNELRANFDDEAGMSMLDYFAAQAMPQVIAHIMTVRATMIKPGQFNFDEVADTAYQVADAMQRERDRRAAIAAAKSPAEHQRAHLSTFGRGGTEDGR